MKKSIILAVVLLIGFVDAANCRTDWIVCDNITLPSYTTDTVVAGGYYAFIDFSNYTKVNNVDIFKQNNVKIRVINSTNPESLGYYFKAIRSLTLYYSFLSNRTANFNGTQVSNPPIVEFCMNKTYTNGVSPGLVTGGGKIITPLYKDAKFKYYFRNWTFRDDQTDQLFSFTGQNASMTIWCQDYDLMTVNLSKSTTASRLVTQTIEEPKFLVQINKAQLRVRQDPDNVLAAPFFLSSAKPATLGKYYFVLQDYTGGQFYGSTLKITLPINNTAAVIHSEKFDSTNTIRVTLLNNTQYGFKVVGGTSTRDIGGQRVVDDSTTRNIIVSRPDMDSGKQRCSNVNMSFTTVYGSKQVGCAIASSAIKNGYFEVYNVTTSGGYLRDYNASSSGYNMAFAFVVDDNNGTYYLHCTANDSSGNLCDKYYLFNMRNTTKIYKGFDLNLPATIMGVSRTFLYKFVSIIVIIIIAGLFSAGSYGTGAVVMAGAIDFFYYIQWLPIPTILAATLSMVAIYMKFSENRQGVMT